MSLGFRVIAALTMLLPAWVPPQAAVPAPRIGIGQATTAPRWQTTSAEQTDPPKVVASPELLRSDCGPDSPLFGLPQGVHDEDRRVTTADTCAPASVFSLGAAGRDRNHAEPQTRRRCLSPPTSD
jgi:hypothetical protein